MPGRVPTLPQPPIVWGPSEVDEWIRGSFPSEGRGPSGPKHAKRIRGLSLKVRSDSVPSVRAQVVVALKALGYTLKGTESRPPLVFRKGDRAVEVRFHPSLLREAVSVAVKFAPPVSEMTPTRIAKALADEFPLGKVSMTEAPRAERAGRGDR